MKRGDLAQKLNSSSVPEEGSPTVLATQVRISRNLDQRFMGRLTGDERLTLRDQLLTRLAEADLLRDSLVIKEDQLEQWEKEYLHAHSEGLGETPGGDPPLAWVFGGDPRLSITIGEVDHLRHTCFRDGPQPEAAWAAVDMLDTALEEVCEYAFDSEFGYLSPVPGLTGTGLRVSLLLHLPALALAGELSKIVRGLGELEVTVGGFRGERPGTASTIWIGNSRCLGRSEMVIIDRLLTMAGKLEEFENRSRERLINKARALLEDRVMSAYGQLKYGRLTGEIRAWELLSAIRLGCTTEIMQRLSLQDVQAIWFRIGRENIQAEEGRKMGNGEVDEYRATMLREWIAGSDNDCRKDNSV